MKTHRTSSGTRIVEHDNGKVIIIPYNTNMAISMSEVEFRELIAYGQAHFELKKRGILK